MLPASAIDTLSILYELQDHSQKGIDKSFSTGRDLRPVLSPLIHRNKIELGLGAFENKKICAR